MFYKKVQLSLQPNTIMKRTLQKEIGDLEYYLNYNKELRRQSYELMNNNISESGICNEIMRTEEQLKKLQKQLEDLNVEKN